MAKTISATTAGRQLSEILDAVEHRGEEFVVERRGRAIATLGAAATAPRRITWGELLGALADMPRPDERFARDLAEIRRRQGRPPRDPWARSSTRRS